MCYLWREQMRTAINLHRRGLKRHYRGVFPRWNGLNDVWWQGGNMRERWNLQIFGMGSTLSQSCEIHIWIKFVVFQKADPKWVSNIWICVYVNVFIHICICVICLVMFPKWQYVRMVTQSNFCTDSTFLWSEAHSTRNSSI